MQLTPAQVNDVYTALEENLRQRDTDLDQHQEIYCMMQEDPYHKEDWYDFGLDGLEDEITYNKLTQYSNMHAKASTWINIR